MRLLAWCCLVVSLPTVAGAQAGLSNTVTIGKVDSMWSAILKEQRKVLVYTPPSYNDTTYLPQKYPVLVLLDGDAHFHSVTGLIQILGTGVNATFVVPEMIVVAVPNTNRMRDLTPTRVATDFDGKPQPSLAITGGMPNFLQFLKTELIPKIDATYRTAPYRILVGHSLGGIAAINALYTMPETFNAYVAIDPSLWWDNRLLLKQAKSYFSRPGLGSRALFVSQANTINPADTTLNVHFNSIAQFNGVLEAYNASGLRYGYKYYSAESHGSVPMISEYDALRFIFEGYQLDLFKSLDQPPYIKGHFSRLSTKLGYALQPPERMLDMLGNIAMGRDSTKAL